MRALRLALAVVAGTLGCRQGPTPEASGDAAPSSELEDALRTAGIEAVTLDAASGGEGAAGGAAPEAYALVRAETEAGTFHVQWADLRRVALGQVAGRAVSGSSESGRYHPAASPAFATLAADSVVAAARAGGVASGAVASGDRATGPLLAVVNGAFFETPMRTSTRLAFPLALGGEVASGGSSSKGPGAPGASGRRWDAPLRVLALGAREARIGELDRATGEVGGAPLGSGPWQDALASYAPEAHPTRRRTRFHALGALDRTGDGAPETLVLVTNDGGSRITDTAAILGALGVAPQSQIAPDGGASVFVWNRAAGALHRPSRNQPLPHYLTLRLR